jgi:UDP-glucuronate decarboxylase
VAPRFDARIAPFSNPHGSRIAANDGRVVSNFVVQALQGEVPTIYGDGSQTRSLCVVDDLFEGLVRLRTLESAPDGPINLGNEREVTIAEIADLVLAMTGSSSGVERLPLPQDDPVRRRPDTARAREILGWEATVPLEVGLPSTIEYFRSVR